MKKGIPSEQQQTSGAFPANGEHHSKNAARKQVAPTLPTLNFAAAAAQHKTKITRHHE